MEGGVGFYRIGGDVPLRCRAVARFTVSMPRRDRRARFKKLKRAAGKDKMPSAERFCTGFAEKVSASYGAEYGVG